MTEIKREFMIGFHEGWTTFWSPFVGFFRAVHGNWKRHVHFSNEGGHKHTSTL